MEQKRSVFERPCDDLKPASSGSAGSVRRGGWAVMLWLTLALAGLGVPHAQGAAVITPIITPAGGSFLSTVTISISCAMSDAAIHYTTNGVVPMEADPLYTGPFGVTAPTGSAVNLKVRAFKDGYLPSAPVSTTYSFLLPSPVYVQAPGELSDPLGPWDGTRQYPLPTIQSAIDAAVDGTEICVINGNYLENINFKNKNIKLYSEDAYTAFRSTSSTVIDGGGIDAAVTFGGGENESCLLRGFLITNGKGIAGGVNGNGTHATIENNLIRYNVARAFLTSSTQATRQELRPVRTAGGTGWTNVPITVHETITHYVATGGGLSGCDGLIQNNVIVSNQYEGPAAAPLSSAKTLPDSTTYIPLDEYVTTPQYHATGSALYRCGGNIFGNTIWDNGPSGAAALAGCAGQIRNNIIWGTGSGPQLAADCAAPTYCCIQGWSGGGEGNIAEDPQLVAPATGSYWISWHSPCIDAGGAVTSQTTDIQCTARGSIGWSYARGDGSRFDIGAFEDVIDRMQLEAPGIFPASGSYPSPLTAWIEADNHGYAQEIRFTLNGQDPVVDETNYNHQTESVYNGWYFSPYLLKLSGMEGTSVTVKARVYLDPHGTGGCSPVAVRTYFFRKAKTFYVDGANEAGPWTGTGDKPFKTIQAALDAAGNGDRITVRPGTYRENIKFHNQDVVLSSENPKSMACVMGTVIDGGAKGPVVEFGGHETRNCLLTGFTITNGLAPMGGGILGHGTQAKIDTNRIINNKAAGGITETDCGEETIDSVVYVKKSALVYGYGGAIYETCGSVINNIITGNVAGGLPLPLVGVQPGTNVKYLSVSADFRGAAIMRCDGLPFCFDTIWGNTCDPGTLGYQTSVVDDCYCAMINSIVWGNNAEVAISFSSGVRNCDVQGSFIGTPGYGNISADPKFVDPAAGDFHLTEGSPCIDTGYGLGALLDFEGNSRGIISIGGRPGDGSHQDMGAFEYPVSKIQTSKPVFSLEAGSYPQGQQLMITCPTMSAAEITYTITDLATGEILVSTKTYTGPITLTAAPLHALKVEALAFVKSANYVASESVTKTYCLLMPAPPLPEINPPSGTYPAPIRISMSDIEPGVTIRYTLDGDDPTGTETSYGATPTETVYTAPFTLSGAPGLTVTVKARASETGYLASPVAVRTYTFAAPRRIFVDDDAKAGGTGGWEAPYRKIQEALDNANSGDTIIVAPGTYRENIEFHGKNLTLQGREPRSWANIRKTIIDGGGNGPTVRFGGSESPACLLTGFTITNGKHTYGGGIAGQWTHATIERNYIVNNTAYGVTSEWEQVRTVQSGASAIEYHDRYRALVGRGGGLGDCVGLIQNNVIAFNRCGEATAKPAAKPAGSTTQVVITYHDAVLYHGSALFHCGKARNNTIWGNSGGVSVVQSCWESFTNNIVWANYPNTFQDSAAPANCDIQDGISGVIGNISLEPRLLDPTRDDFHLRTGSPCIDAGNAATGESLDLEGVTRGYIGTSGTKGPRYDIGAFECVIAPPEMTPDGGTSLTLPLTVPVRCATPGVTIRTTLDGSEPTAASPLYSAPLALKGAPGATLTLKARAFKAGLPDSPVTARTFAFTPLAITQVSRVGVVADKLAATKMVYVGRSLRFVDPIPAALKGQWFLRTLYADKDSNAALSFTVNQPATVVVAVSAGLTTMPGWLKGWTRMSETLKTNDTVPLRVLYKKSFPAGRITLGANREGERSTGQNPYSVIVTP